MGHYPICIGRIYWYDNCPPLDGVDRKRRPVIVVVCDDESGKGIDPVIAVGTTTDWTEHFDRLQMPNLKENPTAATGLPEPCVALPKWVLSIPRSDLAHQNYLGDLTGVLLFRLLEAVEQRLDQPDWDQSEPDTPPKPSN